MEIKIFTQKVYNVAKALENYSTIDLDIIMLAFALTPNKQLIIDPIYEQYKAYADNGKLVIVAAGNFGPLLDTMNPLAISEYVISVGSTNASKTELAKFSSKGFPFEPFNHPTFVTKGENLVYNSKSLTGTSFATSLIVGLVSRIVSYRKKLKLASNLNTIKQILKNAAMPIEGYAKHEIGYGYIDENQLNEYFKSMDNMSLELWGGNKLTYEEWMRSKGEGVTVMNLELE